MSVCRLAALFAAVMICHTMAARAEPIEAGSGARATPAHDLSAPGAPAARQAERQSGSSADAATPETGALRSDAAHPQDAPAEGPEPAPAPRRPQDIVITLATWQSAYNAAQKRALLDPFSADTGYRLNIVGHGGAMSGMSAARAIEGGWDIVELSAEAAAHGCASGWLAPVAPDDLPAGVEGDAAETDYLPGALLSCAAASAAWSAVAVYDARARFAVPPQRIADLFDLPRFPGKRALPATPERLLEAALMADGVAPGEVYAVLDTPQGADRAFARLSAIRHAIVWWRNPADALDAFTPGTPDSLDDVVMGLAFNGRVFTSVIRSHGALRLLWDGQIYQFNYWAIPGSAPEPDAARELLRFVSMPEHQARLTAWFPYGPPRRSALPLVGRHAEIDLDMATFVPTMLAHMERALRFDPAWWAAKGEPLRKRFAAWLALPSPRAPASEFIPPAPARATRPVADMTNQ